MPNDRPSYPDAAHVVTVTGWACRTCGHYWGDNEHAARYCHSSDSPCSDCGAITRKASVRCEKCHEALAISSWKASERAEWNTTDALYSDGLDRYLFDENDLQELINEKDVPDGVDPREFFRFFVCEPSNGRPFDLADHLVDDTSDDGVDVDEEGEAAEKSVNDWIAKHAPFSWSPTNQVPKFADSLVCYAKDLDNAE